ncbi:hypothetical protein F9S50_01325 [Escherichia coli]|nr:hypothetical protein [Escherichia coli]EFH9595466.1 hypothetical protein [Escherichia coli]
MSFHQSATTKNLFCHKAGGSSFSGCQCYFPTYWLGLFRGTAVMQNWINQQNHTIPGKYICTSFAALSRAT